MNIDGIYNTFKQIRHLSNVKGPSNKRGTGYPDKRLLPLGTLAPLHNILPRVKNKIKLNSMASATRRGGGHSNSLVFFSSFFRSSAMTYGRDTCCCAPLICSVYRCSFEPSYSSFLFDAVATGHWPATDTTWNVSVSSTVFYDSSWWPTFRMPIPYYFLLAPKTSTS